MDCIFQLGLLAVVGCIAYRIGKAKGYEEAVSQKRGNRYRHG